LDFELPALVATINFQATLGGKRIDYDLLPAEPTPDRLTTKGRLIRLRLAPTLVGKPGPAVLELAYQLSPDRLGRTPLTTPLAAPRPLDEPVGVPTRWQINAPPDWLILAPETGPGSPRTWGRQGPLLAPLARTTSADLEAWFQGNTPASSLDSSTIPTLELWRDGDSLNLTHVPRRAWLVACSLLIVVLGLALTRLVLAPTPSRVVVAWVLVVGLLVAILGLVVFLPDLSGQLAYGCQPGLVVLILFVLLQWLLHERYRRQIVFLPSFSRVRSGSSLVQAEQVAPQPTGEPSTVDAPRPTGSSVERGS
jgi:hypothetical protein